MARAMGAVSSLHTEEERILEGLADFLLTRFTGQFFFHTTSDQRPLGLTKKKREMFEGYGILLFSPKKKVGNIQKENPIRMGASVFLVCQTMI